ncbi:NAD-dependent epimerase/dehydratase family protein [Microbacterium sp. NPDC091382]|uniref:NAD-dependent epimerase/dehydratase family protein n=1 Tax=Microbacterium sp. NPDC091382 TaxID=3364210 RepID=UPI00381CB35B
MNTLAGSRWVVTGAAGNIGVALRRELRAAAVALVSTDVRYVEPVDRTGDRTLVADLADLAALEEMFAGADGVIHLGGLSDEADFHDLAQVNVVGTYHVLEAARRSGVPRVVYASSNRVTGMYPTDALVDPDMPPRPDGFYGVSKVAGEALCRLYSDKFSLSTIALRIGSYEKEPSNPRERSTWLSHRDAIAAVTAAMTTDEHHAVFYAVSANTEAWWDRAAGERVGFRPTDDAADWDIPGDTVEPQGGPFATASYSLDRMRD